MAQGQNGVDRGAWPGMLRVLAAAGAMGTLGPVAGVAYREGISAPAFSALRAGLGAAVLAVLLIAGRQPSVPLSRIPFAERRALALAVVVNGVMNLALFLAFGAMAVILVMAVYFTYPALVAVLSAALGREPLTRRRLLALAVAAGGLALVLGGQLDPDARATAAGVALAALAAACQATYLVAIRGGFDSVPAVQATAVVLGGGLVISGITALVADGSGALGGRTAAPVAWAAIAVAGTIGALPKVWILGGVRLVGSTRAAIGLLAEPVVAVVVAALILGQTLTPAEVAGGAAIGAAVVLVQLPVSLDRRRARVVGDGTGAAVSALTTPGEQPTVQDNRLSMSDRSGTDRH